MRRELIASALVLCAGLAHATDCTLVFGQGRNARLVGGPDWDDLNRRFSTTVAGALEAAGERVHPMTASIAEIDAQAVGRLLLKEADQRGCRTLVETTVFTHGQDTLVLRLRAYPLLPQIGEGGTIIGLRIGEPLFVTQRDLPPAALLRMKPDELAAQMAAEYLQHERH